MKGKEGLSGPVRGAVGGGGCDGAPHVDQPQFLLGAWVQNHHCTLGLQTAQSRSYLYTLGPKVGIIYILGAPGVGKKATHRGRKRSGKSFLSRIDTYTPQCSSIKGLMVSIRCYLGFLKGQWGGAGRSPLFSRPSPHKGTFGAYSGGHWGLYGGLGVGGVSFTEGSYQPSEKHQQCPCFRSHPFGKLNEAEGNKQLKTSPVRSFGAHKERKIDRYIDR